MRTGSDAPPWNLLLRAGGEAVLPAGMRLADERRPSRCCYVMMDGTATVEVAGNRLGELGAGAFIGQVDARGYPLPARGLTLRLATPARVLVIEPERLAALIETDPAAADAWRQLRSWS